MKYLFTSIFLALNIFYANAQKIEQTVFTNAINQTPLPGLYIKIITESDTTTLKTGVDGEVKFECDENATIILIADNDGYFYYVEEFKPSKEPKYIYLERIVELEGVTVAVKKQNIKRSFGTTTLRIDDSSPLFMNTTLMDAIKLIPEVNVDESSGKIKVLGKSKTLYLVNGRPTNRSIKDFQSNQIKEVRVVSNPSSKYQASYDSVIDIILKDSESTGWYLNLNSSVYRSRAWSNYNSLDAGLNIGKWSANGSFAYNIMNGKQINYGWQEYADKFEDYTVDNTMHVENIETSANINYSITDNSNIGVDFSYGTNPENIVKEETESNFNYLNSTEDSITMSDIEYDNNYRSTNASVYYDLSKGKSKLSSYVSYIENKQGFSNDITSRYNSTPLMAQNVLSDDNNKTYIINTDYEYDVNDKNSIEAGARVSMFDGDYSISSTNFGSPVSSTLFDFTENVYSAYAMYKLGINRFDFSAGLRYEYFDRDVTFNKEDDYTTNQGGLFPNAHVGYKSADAKSSFSLSYARKIERPSFSDITPFEYNYNYNSIVKGNPDLKNEYIHSLQFRYSHSSPNSGTKLEVIPYFNYYENNIEQVSTFDGDNLIWYATNYDVKNIGSIFMYNFSVLGNKLSFYNKMTVDYIENKGIVNGVALDASNWQCGVFLTQVYNITDKMGITVSTSYSSPQLSDYYKIKQGIKTDIRFSTKLFNDRVDLSVRARDVFNTFYYDMSGNYDGFESFKHSDFNMRNIGLSVRYNFQSGRKVKSNPVDIDNSKEKLRINN